MKESNIQAFFKAVNKDPKIKQEMEIIRGEYPEGNMNAEDSFNFITKGIIPLAKKNGYEFNFREYISFQLKDELKEELTEDDLMEISGGGFFSPRNLGAASVAALSIFTTLGGPAIQSLKNSQLSSTSQSISSTSQSIDSQFKKTSDKGRNKINFFNSNIFRSKKTKENSNNKSKNERKLENKKNEKRAENIGNSKTNKSTSSNVNVGKSQKNNVNISRFRKNRTGNKISSNIKNSSFKKNRTVLKSKNNVRKINKNVGTSSLNKEASKKNTIKEKELEKTENSDNLKENENQKVEDKNIEKTEKEELDKTENNDNKDENKEVQDKNTEEKEEETEKKELDKQEKTEKEELDKTENNDNKDENEEVQDKNTKEKEEATKKEKNLLFEEEDISIITGSASAGNFTMMPPPPPPKPTPFKNNNNNNANQEESIETQEKRFESCKSKFQNLKSEGEKISFEVIIETEDESKPYTINLEKTVRNEKDMKDYTENVKEQTERLNKEITKRKEKSTSFKDSIDKIIDKIASDIKSERAGTIVQNINGNNYVFALKFDNDFFKMNLEEFFNQYENLVSQKMILEERQKEFEDLKEKFSTQKDSMRKNLEIIKDMEKTVEDLKKEQEKNVYLNPEFQDEKNYINFLEELYANNENISDIDIGFQDYKNIDNIEKNEASKKIKQLQEKNIKLNEEIDENNVKIGTHFVSVEEELQKNEKTLKKTMHVFDVGTEGKKITVSSYDMIARILSDKEGYDAAWESLNSSSKSNIQGLLSQKGNKNTDLMTYKAWKTLLSTEKDNDEILQIIGKISTISSANIAKSEEIRKNNEQIKNYQETLTEKNIIKIASIELTKKAANFHASKIFTKIAKLDKESGFFDTVSNVISKLKAKGVRYTQKEARVANEIFEIFGLKTVDENTECNDNLSFRREVALNLAKICNEIFENDAMSLKQKKEDIVKNFYNLFSTRFSNVQKLDFKTIEMNFFEAFKSDGGSLYKEILKIKQNYDSNETLISKELQNTYSKSNLIKNLSKVKSEGSFKFSYNSLKSSKTTSAEGESNLKNISERLKAYVETNFEKLKTTDELNEAVNDTRFLTQALIKLGFKSFMGITTEEENIQKISDTKTPLKFKKIFAKIYNFLEEFQKENEGDLKEIFVSQSINVEKNKSNIDESKSTLRMIKYFDTFNPSLSVENTSNVSNNYQKSSDGQKDNSNKPINSVVANVTSENLTKKTGEQEFTNKVFFKKDEASETKKKEFKAGIMAEIQTIKNIISTVTEGTNKKTTETEAEKNIIMDENSIKMCKELSKINETVTETRHKAILPKIFDIANKAVQVFKAIGIDGYEPVLSYADGTGNSYPKVKYTGTAEGNFTDFFKTNNAKLEILKFQELGKIYDYDKQVFNIENVDPAKNPMISRISEMPNIAVEYTNDNNKKLKVLENDGMLISAMNVIQNLAAILKNLEGTNENVEDDAKINSLVDIEISNRGIDTSLNTRSWVVHNILETFRK
ncbi:MAG: hypothetical protein LBT82_02380 [Oscillospiraceae bacterium]|jgi:hypothetical protein|nr:hypothetical protein [Oscillospiraceae bacterium]